MLTGRVAERSALPERRWDLATGRDRSRRTSDAASDRPQAWTSSILQRTWVSPSLRCPAFPSSVVLPRRSLREVDQGGARMVGLTSGGGVARKVLAALPRFGVRDSPPTEVSFSRARKSDALGRLQASLASQSLDAILSAAAHRAERVRTPWSTCRGPPDRAPRRTQQIDR